MSVQNGLPSAWRHLVGVRADKFIIQKHYPFNSPVIPIHLQNYVFFNCS